MPSPQQPWGVVVPVKRLTAAKSRLDVAPDLRRDLALAMATDTVTACVAADLVRIVVVVCDDTVAAAAMAVAGATVVPDEPDAGLNAALLHGAASLASSFPELAVVAVSSDLPALTPAALDQVLTRAAQVPTSCVADAGGTGTTLLAAHTLVTFAPRFGPDSFRRHRAEGAVDLTAYADERLRRDVDTREDLRRALTLGCGSATTEAVRRLE